AAPRASVKPVRGSEQRGFAKSFRRCADFFPVFVSLENALPFQLCRSSTLAATLNIALPPPLVNHFAPLFAPFCLLRRFITFSK
ncbi:MAG: hypothetical protein Q3984_07585, partial [Eubacteriales bacterium]|nr:hypothetical protein [Eubacteriales bacterium]